VKQKPSRNLWREILHSFARPREAFSSYSHFAGAILSILALIALLLRLPEGSKPGAYISLAVFAVSMFLLYTTSGFYHLIVSSQKVIEALRRLDHIMIYMLIAGTCTPVCVIFLSGGWRWGMLAAIWSLAAAGLVFKLLWISAPRWLSTLSYVLMGWVVAVAILPLSRSLAVSGLVWLVAGGLFYSVGALIYATRFPRLNLKGFGFHEIFHLFVLAGSSSHFWLFFSSI
jgi:hemolysin III